MRIKILSWIILSNNYKRPLKKFHPPTECGTTPFSPLSAEYFSLNIAIMRIEILSWIILSNNYKRLLKKFHRLTECGIRIIAIFLKKY